MIHFDFDDRYEDELVVGNALPRPVRIAISLVIHVVIIATLIILPRVVLFGLTPEEQARRIAELREKQRMLAREDRTFVFVQPRVDIESPKPPDRADASDKNRVARTPERPENPTNPLPYMRGNTPERVESPPVARSRGPVSPQPPSPGDAQQAQPPPAETKQTLPPADSGLTVPREVQRQARAGSGALGEALSNLQRYVQSESFDNPKGGNAQFGPFIQFDTKGVEFGPWVRRFVAQVKRNWYIPDAAMFTRGHVVLQFNVHRDGRITDLAMVGPSASDALNNSSLNAILASNPTAPLPPEYPTDTAFFTVTFFYGEEPPGQ